MCLTDRNGNIWFDTFLQENTTAAEAGAYEYAMESGDIYVDAAASEQAEASEGYDAYQGRYALTFADGLEAELDIFSAMKAVNQATEAMRKLLPLLTLAVLALSFLGAVIYSRVITPVSYTHLHAIVTEDELALRQRYVHAKELPRAFDDLNVGV